MDTGAHVLTFAQALAQAELLALQKLPAVLHERISCGVALVREGKVLQEDDHHWTVESTSTPGKVYAINGTCTCEDAHFRAPEGLCKHRLGAYLARKSLELVHAAPPASPVEEEASTPARTPWDDWPPEETLAPMPPGSQGIPRQFLRQVHGKDFVEYPGLLAMAHAQGLQSLVARLTRVTDQPALAEATATFSDGRIFSEAADATPENVGATVRAHVPRVALTRAKARALRDALNIGICAVEELE